MVGLTPPCAHRLDPNWRSCRACEWKVSHFPHHHPTPVMRSEAPRRQHVPLVTDPKAGAPCQRLSVFAPAAPPPAVSRRGEAMRRVGEKFAQPVPLSSIVPTNRSLPRRVPRGGFVLPEARAGRTPDTRPSRRVPTTRKFFRLFSPAVCG